MFGSEMKDRYWYMVALSLAHLTVLLPAEIRATCRPGLGCGSPRFERPLSAQEALQREQGEFGASCLAGGFLGTVLLLGASQIALQVVAGRKGSAKGELTADSRNRD
jgi:hypothetical protein